MRPETESVAGYFGENLRDRVISVKLGLAQGESAGASE
jgi:hypothetical protein